MAFRLCAGPLRVQPWMLREIASAAGGDSPNARMTHSDLAFIGAPEVADMAMTAEDDPAWDAPMAAFARMLTDRSPEATARILAHVTSVAGMQGEVYDTIMVDPVIGSLATTLGNSVAGLIMMTRIHEDQALNWADAPEGEDDAADATVAVNLEDVLYEGEVLPFLSLGFEIADGIQLEAGRLEVLTPVPETIAASLPGRRLADFISHPLLDPLEVRIRSFDGIALNLDHDGMATRAFA